MNWPLLLILGLIVTGVLLLKKTGELSTNAALAYLQQGALVIDVRTPGEFNGGHLASAINIPLDEIATELPRRVPDKTQVLLLHCASGVRSGMAKSKLRRLGYTQAFNLGSYGRAEHLVHQAPPPKS